MEAEAFTEAARGFVVLDAALAGDFAAGRDAGLALDLAAGLVAFGGDLAACFAGLAAALAAGFAGALPLRLVFDCAVAFMTLPARSSSRVTATPAIRRTDPSPMGKAGRAATATRHFP